MTTLDLSYLKARRAFPTHCPHLHLIQVGCGGIGGQLAPSTARIARECQRHFEEVTVSFFDGDIVEDKNIRRQQFCEAEIGHNKAEALAYRLNMAWGMEIRAYPIHFKGTIDTAFSEPNTLTILIGCVDNAVARRSLHEIISRQRPGEDNPTWWLDGGCLQTQRQILLGNTKDTNILTSGLALPGLCTALPSPAWLHPELLKARADERPGHQQSCAEAALTDPQSLTINMVIAAQMADYLLRLLVTKDLCRYATYIDMDSGSMRSLSITAAQLEQSLDLPPNSLSGSTTSQAA
jgi:PRTRC genetic system ThiF family protein